VRSIALGYKAGALAATRSPRSASDLTAQPAAQTKTRRSLGSELRRQSSKPSELALAAKVINRLLFLPGHDGRWVLLKLQTGVQGGWN